MKKYFPLLLLLVFPFVTSAQKIDDQPVEFDIIRYPILGLPQNIKAYTSEVIMDYEGGVLEMQKMRTEDYATALKKYEELYPVAQRKFDSLMVIYNRDKEIALAKYDSSMVEYRKKPQVERFVENRILRENDHPRLMMPQYPYVQFPVKPYPTREEYPKLFNKQMLAETYLKLDGYPRSNTNAVKFVVTMLGYDFLDPVLRNESSNVYNTDTKQTTTVIKYWYEISYRHPMNLKMISPDGKVMLDITFEDLTNYTIFKTPIANNTAPRIDRKALKMSFEDQIVEQNMLYIREYINDYYGYTPMKHPAIIYRIDSKKFNYDTYQLAYEEIVSGFNALSTDRKKAEEKINAAIAIWEEEMKTYDPADTKGRLTSDIAIATRFNLYEAYLWLNKFDQAEEQLSKVIGLRPSKKQENLVKQYREFLKMQRQRF